MEKVVCVGWIESYVKSIETREYLFDLDAGAKGLLAKHGRSDELDLMFKYMQTFLDYLVIKHFIHSIENNSLIIYYKKR